MPAKRDHVSLVFTGPYVWSTFSIFNANAYPQYAESNVRSCTTRLALCLLYLDETKKSVIEAKRDFLMSLEKNREDGERGLKKTNDELKYVAYSDGLRYVAALYSFVNAVKSFLDVYANLMGKLISPTISWSFKRGNVGGESIAGGKLIRWLENCSSKNYPHADRLAKVSQNHSKKWATPLVAYRDDLSHYRDLTGFVHMHVSLHKSTPWYQESEISGPSMPHGESVEEYCEIIVSQLADYIRETVVILPAVDQKLISVDRFLKE